MNSIFQPKGKGKYSKAGKWLNSKNGCITIIAASFLFIAVFILDIIVNHNWVSAIFIIPYGMIVSNRLAQLRRLADD